MTNNIASFHMPVMGISFTLDSPIRVAKYGISSAISLVNDDIIEKARKFYSNKYNFSYQAIGTTEPDYRAKRITAYLNLVDEIVSKDFLELKKQPFEANSEITKYFELLPNESTLKIDYLKMQEMPSGKEKEDFGQSLRERIKPGSIDVNIMVKLDRDLYKNGEKLPMEHSDASAALRGYALSNLSSSVVLSAGFNRRLISYMENFEDFLPDANGNLKKKIILKVSDFRSALTQGRLFAKKRLWISEFRLESGLNCGGHTFSTRGLLMGPILELFKTEKENLSQSLFEIYNKSLEKAGSFVPTEPPPINLTAQGGIGTSQEHYQLLNYYNLNSVGWGTPFLLVPEAVNIDDETLKRLCDAKEDDIISSDVSPINITFSNLRNSLSEEAKEKRIQEGNPGSICAYGHLAYNTEFTKNPICTASRTYQKKKIEQLKSLNLPEKEYNLEYEKITVKSCICKDLAGSADINFNTFKSEPTPAVCPGPNLKYFSKTRSLKEMVDHIYGRTDILQDDSRSHVFINELMIYIKDFTEEAQRYAKKPSEKGMKALEKYYLNIMDGVEYYSKIADKLLQNSEANKSKFINDLENIKDELVSLKPV